MVVGNIANKDSPVCDWDQPIALGHCRGKQGQKGFGVTDADWTERRMMPQQKLEKIACEEDLEDAANLVETCWIWGSIPDEDVH